MDDSGSMDTKELARLLFTLIDNGEKVIDDDNGDMMMMVVMMMVMMMMMMVITTIGVLLD